MGDFNTQFIQVLVLFHLYSGCTHTGSYEQMYLHLFELPNGAYVLLCDEHMASSPFTPKLYLDFPVANIPLSFNFISCMGWS